MKPSVLALIPIKPSIHTELRKRAMVLAANMLAACEQLDMTLVFDGRPVSLPPDQPRTHRPWEKVAVIRNMMIDAVDWSRYDYVLWVDADLVDYPPDLAEWLVHGAMTHANGGVCAPTVLIENVPGSGIAADHFYDWAAFQYRNTSHIEPGNREWVRGRNIECRPPYYWPNPVTEPKVGCVPFVEMDSVGACYAMSTDILRTGVRFSDHPTATDHQPICAKAWEMGRKVVALPNIIVRHAFLPRFGEAFH